MSPCVLEEGGERCAGDEIRVERRGLGEVEREGGGEEGRER